MRCRECNAETEHKLISEGYTRKGSNVIVKVKDIPAEACPVCGERYVELDVLKELDLILEPLLESGKTFEGVNQWLQKIGDLLIMIILEESSC